MTPGPTYADHVFVLLFAVVYPVAGYISFRRLLDRIEAGLQADRANLYRHTIVGHWLLVAIGLYIWWRSSRSLEDLGFGPAGGGSGFLLAALIVAGAVYLLAAQLRAARRADRDWLDSADRSFGVLRHLLPRSPAELRGFYAVGITAGIAEEILWRGYLIPYLAAYMGMTLAVLAGIVGFGLAHAYQGLASTPRIMLVGAVLTGLYLLSGSLWLPMLLHVLIDVMQGRLAYDVMIRRKVYAGVDV
jgi:membrane protease YdiL (CAAX protease family)